LSYFAIVSALHISESNFYRAMRMHSADYALSTCLSICLSVTRRYSVETTKHTIKVFLLSGSQTILVSPYKTGWQYSDGGPSNGGVQCRGIRKKSRFSTNISLYLWNDAR